MVGDQYDLAYLDQPQDVHKNRLRRALFCQEGQLLSPQKGAERLKILQKAKARMFVIISRLSSSGSKIYTPKASKRSRHKSSRRWRRQRRQGRENN